eukprot:6326117-Pyramimonas_sp.AAC.1
MSELPEIESPRALARKARPSNPATLCPVPGDLFHGGGPLTGPSTSGNVSGLVVATSPASP